MSKYNAKQWTWRWDAQHICWAAITCASRLSCACIDTLHIWVPLCIIDWCCLTLYFQCTSVTKCISTCSSECGAGVHSMFSSITSPLLLIALIAAHDWQHFNKSILIRCPQPYVVYTRHTTQLSHSDSPNYQTPHTEGHEQVQSHISHKSAHHRTYKISPNRIAPGFWPPTAGRTQSRKQVAERALSYYYCSQKKWKKPKQCSQTISNNSPSREQTVPLTL